MKKKVLAVTLATVLALSLGLVMAGPVGADDPVPFTCTDGPFIVYDPATQLNQIVLSPPGPPGFTFNNIPPSPINGLQINNLGYRSTDGLLYGWERNATDNAGQIVQIDRTGAVNGLGQPVPPLPANQPSGQPTAYNYNAGDVSVDGSKMYLSYSQANGSGGPLYVVDLPALTSSIVTITGGTGAVADWAAHPTNGLLYGGDHTEWELASLDPTTGMRTDVGIGLPDEGSKGYGAAWFDATGRLYLYHNSGKIYAVDNLDTTPTLVGVPYPLVNLDLNTSNNDGANCAAGVQEDVEVEKDYRYTDVCFEKDNDGDGLFNEDPVDGIDNDGDDLIDEDDIDCPEGTDLGIPLPTDVDGNYLLEAVIHPKNDKVRSYNPGQYYAVSTVTVLVDIDTLTIVEDWSACDEISALNPPNGGGSVVVVQVGPDGVAYQILDATSGAVTITGNTATAVLQNVLAGTTIYMYVKFGPGLKGEVWNPPDGYYGPCVNSNMAEATLGDITQQETASANLIVVEKD